MAKTKIIASAQQITLDCSGLEKGWGFTLGNLLKDSIITFINKKNVYHIEILVDGKHRHTNLPCDCNYDLLITQILSCLTSQNNSKIVVSLKKQDHVREIKSQDIDPLCQQNYTLFTYNGACNLDIIIHFSLQRHLNSYADGIFSFYEDDVAQSFSLAQIEVSNFRVGEDNEFNRLLLDIQVKDQASYPVIVLGKITQFLHDTIASCIVDESSLQEQINTDNLTLPISIIATLRTEGITTLKQFRSLTKKDLLDMPSLSQEEIDQIQQQQLEFSLSCNK